MNSKSSLKMAYEVDAARESFEKAVEIMSREVSIPTSKSRNATFDEKDLHRSLIELSISDGYAESLSESFAANEPLLSGKVPSGSWIRKTVERINEKEMELKLQEALNSTVKQLASYKIFSAPIIAGVDTQKIRRYDPNADGGEGGQPDCLDDRVRARGFGNAVLRPKPGEHNPVRSTQRPENGNHSNILGTRIRKQLRGFHFCTHPEISEQPVHRLRQVRTGNWRRRLSSAEFHRATVPIPTQIIRILAAGLAKLHLSDARLRSLAALSEAADGRDKLHPQPERLDRRSRGGKSRPRWHRVREPGPHLTRHPEVQRQRFLRCRLVQPV